MRKIIAQSIPFLSKMSATAGKIPGHNDCETTEHVNQSTNNLNKQF